MKKYSKPLLKKKAAVSASKSACGTNYSCGDLVKKW